MNSVIVISDIALYTCGLFGVPLVVKLSYYVYVPSSIVVVVVFVVKLLHFSLRVFFALNQHRVP